MLKNILSIIAIFTGFWLRISTKRVILYDSTRESMLEWTTYSASGISEDGWTEESYTDLKDNINWRSYVACDVGKESVNNWVRMPFVERGDARRISVELTFAIRDCQNFPRTALTCRETFSLLAFEADIDFANSDQPPWRTTTDHSSASSGSSSSTDYYKQIDRLTAVSGRYTHQEKPGLSVEIRHIPVSKRGLYLAFRDEGACVSLLAVKVYYEVCEETITNYAQFAETAVGPNLTSIREVRGRCVQNASSPSSSLGGVKYFCKGDGSWDLLNGACQCDPGFKADGTRCLPCPLGFYKDTPGLAACTPCPLNSASSALGSSGCACKPGYYRSPYDSSKSADCESLPSAPLNLNLLYAEQTKLVIGWTPPSDLGNRPKIWYRVECPDCPVDTTFTPKKSGFLANNVTLANLESMTAYTVFVYAENDLTLQLAGVDGFVPPAPAKLQVTTEPRSASSYMDVVVLDYVSSTEMVFQWDPPTFNHPKIHPLLRSGVKTAEDAQVIFEYFTTLSPMQRHDAVRYYTIRLFIRDYKANEDKRLISPAMYSGGAATNNETLSIVDPMFRFTQLKPDTEYAFQVRANSVYGWSEWSTIFWATTNSSVEEASTIAITSRSNSSEYSGVNLPGKVGGIAAAVVISIFAIAGVIWWVVRKRRGNDGCCQKRQRHHHHHKPTSSKRNFNGGLDFVKNSHALAVNHFQPAAGCNGTPPQGGPCGQWRVCNTFGGTLSSQLFLSEEPPRQENIVGIGGYGGTLAPDHSSNSASKQYVDPLTYEDPNRRLRDFTTEIDPNSINIEEVIGEGEFGKVCKGKLFFGALPTNLAETVAIKTLKPGSSDKAKADFLMEASIMGQFEHPNVVRLKGVVTCHEPVMIITEFVENGSLDKHLQDQKQFLESRHLIEMLRCVASGMTYLSGMGYVHRDLAARNILVDAHRSCKIADFGLSRGMEDGSADEQVYVTKGGIIPVRWTAPEAVSYRKFTSSSDVWSFGVVMWEVLSYGQRPYGHWTNREVIGAIDNGYRLENPEGCPRALYSLMRQCWEEKRQLRPTFRVILQRLDMFLQHPETLSVESNNCFSPAATAGSLISLRSSPAAVMQASASSTTPSSGIPPWPPNNSTNNNNNNRTSACTNSSGFVSSTSSGGSGGNGASSSSSTNPFRPLPSLPHLTPTDYVLSQTALSDFFRDLNMDHYTVMFQRRNRHTVLDLTGLTVLDLATMGVPVEDRNRILDAIDNLRRRHHQYAVVMDSVRMPGGTGGSRPPKGPPPPPPPPLMAPSAGASLRRGLRANKNEGNYV